MLHVFLKLRPRQLRGVPFLAATTPKIFDLDEYSDAELIGNKIAACLAVIITQPAGEPDSDLLAGKTGQALTDMKGNPIRNLEPGMIGVTRQGAGVNVVSPQKPGTTFGMFMRYNQNLIGTGAQYGISYLTMTRDMQGVTHAGGRLAQQMDFQAIRPLQRWFSRKMCRNIFNTWHSVAVMAGKIKAPGYFQDKAAMRFWRRHMWMPGGWHLGTNPLQEIEASVQSMRAGITTPDDECARLGHDADTQLMKIRRYQRKARKYGVVVESDAAVGRISRQGAAPTTDEDGATKLEDLNNGEQT
jgi:lambda family phage portal protein